jgi:histidine triad (HIT) family protein
MPLTDEQAKTIKEQLLKQIESFPEDKREGIKQYITGLDNKGLEEFLIKNKLIKAEGQEADGGSEEEKPSAAAKSSGKGQCVMCMLANKQIESLAIYEDKDYLAALEINPITSGHVLLIPKQHIAETKQIKSKAFTIANKIGKHLVKKLGAENFQINSSDETKHAIINIIPRYKGQEISYERKPAKKQELQEIAMKIGSMTKKESKPKVKKEEKKVEKSSENSNILKLPRRIP